MSSISTGNSNVAEIKLDSESSKQERVDNCVKQISELLEKFECDLIAQVIIDGSISYSNGNGTIVKAEPRVVPKERKDG